MLTPKDNITELHALWDSTVYEWDEDFQQPFSDETWAQIGAISNGLRITHPMLDMLDLL